MSETRTTIIGAGVAGLTVANLLRQCGIDCVVLERRSREHVEQRQRAGAVDARAVRIFEEWGLADRVLGGTPLTGVTEYRVDGVKHLFTAKRDDGSPGRQCPQQVLVRNLIATFLDDGGDLRFEVSDVELDNPASARPTVRYRDREGVRHEITSEFVAGCDGDRGISRESIPDGVLTRHTHDYGISWLTVLADVPVTGPPLSAISRHGYAAQFARGPRASRFYLECPADDTAADWPDERIWAQLRIRLGDQGLASGAIVDKHVFPLRSVVHEPMSHHRLFLVGDAAHIVPPPSVKGMNLAIHDADALVQAIRDFVRDGDDGGLRSYSTTGLDRVWNYQEWAVSVTEMLHDAGDDARRGPFRRRIALARLTRLLTSPTANRLHSEFMAGTN